MSEDVADWSGYDEMQPKKRKASSRPVIRRPYAEDKLALDPDLFDDGGSERLPMRDIRLLKAAEIAIKSFVEVDAEVLDKTLELVDRSDRAQEMKSDEISEMYDFSCKFQGAIYKLARRFKSEDPDIDLLFGNLAKRLDEKIKKPHSSKEVVGPLLNGGLGMVTAEMVFRKLIGKGVETSIVHDVEMDKLLSTDLIVETEKMVFLLQIKSSMRNGSGMVEIQNSDAPLLFEGADISRGSLDKILRNKRELGSGKHDKKKVVALAVVVPAAGVGKVRTNGMLKDESLVDRYKSEFDRIVEKYVKA